MRRFFTSVGCALVLVAGHALAQAQAQPTKTVNGSITAIAADSVTVKTGGQDMTFVVDSKTHVIAPGGASKTRAAQAEGRAGPSVTDLLKTGQAVEVIYHEQGMHAASIRATEMVPAAAKTLTATGVVSAISGDSLTVKGATAEWTFSVDRKTTVSGSGVSMARKKLMSEGGKPTLTNFVHEGDTVSVTYRDMDSMKHASLVRITRRKM